MASALPCRFGVFREGLEFVVEDLLDSALCQGPEQRGEHARELGASDDTVRYRLKALEGSVLAQATGGEVTMGEFALLARE